MKKERVQLYINKNALERFDTEAKNQGLTRTALVQFLINEYLARKGAVRYEAIK